MTDTRQQAIANRLTGLRQDIQDWCRHYRGQSDCARLLAVSKTFPVADLQAAFDAGQRLFGESYLNEALDKMAAFDGKPVEWHFIGPIQSNKTRRIAEYFDWVQSVDRLKVARRLSEQRPDDKPDLNICLQVNTSGEGSKSGMSAGELADMIAEVAELPRLKLRGLMAIPARSSDFTEQRSAFAALKQLQEHCSTRGYPLDTLSMGMSGDIEAAIAEGSTLVRVGTGIFGARKKTK